MWTNVCNNQWTASGALKHSLFWKQYLLYPYAPEDLAGAAGRVGQSVGSGRHRRFCVYAGSISWLLRGICRVSGFLPDPECPCQPKLAGRRRTPPAFLKVRNTIPEVYQPAGRYRRANAAAIQKLERLLGYLAEVERLRNPLAPSGRGSRYGEGQGKCTLIHTQRHGRDFIVHRSFGPAELSVSRTAERGGHRDR